jgi:hypothetical protein
MVLVVVSFEGNVCSGIPPPPPYYKLYTDFNDDPSSTPPLPAPIVGTYVQYGDNYTVRIILFPPYSMYLDY